MQDETAPGQDGGVLAPGTACYKPVRAVALLKAVFVHVLHTFCVYAPPFGPFRAGRLRAHVATRVRIIGNEGSHVTRAPSPLPKGHTGPPECMWESSSGDTATLIRTRARAIWGNDSGRRAHKAEAFTGLLRKAGRAPLSPANWEGQLRVKRTREGVGN